MTVQTHELVALRDKCIALLEGRGVPYVGYVDLQRHVSKTVAFRKYTRARSLFAEQNIGLVHLIVKRQFAGHARKFGYEDLVQEGLFGVLRAIDLYQPDVARFATYASWWIRHSVQRAVENKLRLVRIPSYQLAKVNKLKRQLRESDTLDDSDLEYLRAMLLKMVCSVPGQEVFERRFIVYEIDEALTVRAVLEMLDGRDLYIVKQRFGFGCAPRSLQEIGEELGMTKERVRQIEERALEKLREAIK